MRKDDPRLSQFEIPEEEGKVNPVKKHGPP